MSRFYDALREAGRLPSDATLPCQDHIADSADGTTATPPSIGPDTGAPALAEADPWVSSTPGREILESPKLPEIGSIRSPLAGSLSYKALIRNGVHPVVVERYRRLRTKIIQLQADQHFQSLVVTSPNPEEGKTVTVLNLALSFGLLSTFNILIVDADLRRGSLGKWLGAGERPGLSNLIDGSAQLSDVIWKSDEMPLSFVSGGTSKIPPAELLQSSRVKGQLQEMTEQFPLVLIDSPPVNITTDAQLLAANCDAVLLVTRAFVSTRKALEKAVQDLSPNRVIGTILNGGTRSQGYRRYTEYY
jgi:capsular exopolysaccharide synthesis family protein